MSASATAPEQLASTTTETVHEKETSTEIQHEPCPEAKSSWIARLLLIWVIPLVYKGWKTPLQEEDLWELPDFERGEYTTAALISAWKSIKTEGKTKHRLQNCIIRSFRDMFIATGIYRLISITVFATQPVFLNQFIKFLQSRDEKPISEGLGWAIAIFTAPLIRTIFENQFYQSSLRGGMRIRSSLQGALYDKSLTISPCARASSSLGEIVNLMQLDSQRIGDAIPFVHMIWMTPIEIIVSAGLLYNYIGRSALIGLTATLLTLPIHGKLVAIYVNLRKASIKIVDKRVKLMNEILQGIKAVKFYAWEQSFSSTVLDYRREELKIRFRSIWVRSAVTVIITTLPIFIAVITFSFYTGVFNEELNVAKIFTGLSILNQLRVPLMLLPVAINQYIDSRLGLKRIEHFLDLEDADNYSRASPNKPEKPAENVDSHASSSHSSLTSEPPFISISNGEFEWDQIAENPLQIEKKKSGCTARSCLPRRRKKTAKPDGSTVDVQSSTGITKAVSSKTQDTSQPSEADGVEGTVSPSTSLNKYVPLRRSVLHDINIRFESNQLTAIVGFVASGKSSLLHAIMGEMRKIKGDVMLHGSVAYVSETAWIFNASLRENIVFGKAFDENLYNQAVEAAGLLPDIEVLPAGDLTAIGEKGINLSGGQKQRVSIARALYAQADIYLFDDPLSSLDAHVSQHVFNKCISNGGLLHDKLRILVTNQINVLPDCDRILFLDSGIVKRQGTYQELARDEDSFKTLISEQEKAMEEANKEAVDEEKGSKDGQADSPEEKSPNNANMEALAKKSPGGGNVMAAKTIMQDEERKTGNVLSKTYFDYLKSLGGFFSFLLLFVFYCFASAVPLIIQWWLSFWVGEETGAVDEIAGRPTSFYLGIYFSLAIGYSLLAFVATVWHSWLSIIASRKMHDDMLQSVLRAPMAFFDTTPIGRVLSRFSRDVAAVDELIPQFFERMLILLLGLLLTYAFVGIFIPPFFAVMVPVTSFYFLLQRFFNRTSLELMRLDSISKSPIYANFSETLGGLSTLRAFGKQEQFRRENMKKIDLNQRAFFAFILTNRWFSLTLEAAGSLLILSVALFAIFLRNDDNLENIALVMTYTVSVSAFLGFTVRSITELEGQMNSVERIIYYSTELPQEAASDVDGAVPETWPSKGAIEFEAVEMRYREGLPLVLKGVNLKVNGGEKVGVVGRTGCGKSSLMMVLLRLVELSSGKISVDGIDLREIGLNDVRKKMTIIPQDPVMFSGTMRFNIDPTHEFSDVELWSALEKTHMKEFVASSETGLDALISEYGENLSAGQRQMICLTRALLRNTKILILDEASSSLDMETDRTLQETIRTHLKNATILTIAHRLFTLADYDKIVVMDDGVVVESGTPGELLNISNGHLNALVDSVGTAGAAHFRRRVSMAV